MSATAIIPVKRFPTAKQRLGSQISGAQRRDLIPAMLADVLAAVAAARMVERTLLVTGEPAVEEIAAAAGIEVVPDVSDSGHPEAALLGIARAQEAGADCVALLPGDCPLLDPRELDRLLTGIPSDYVAVVPDRHGTGTNALVLSPPDAIAPAFGEGSCERHVALARDAGIPFSVERLASLALDLDTPADIIALRGELDSGRGGAPNTAKVLGI